MIDPPNLTELVQDEIKRSVDRYVSVCLADQRWQTSLEQQITDFVKDRITARFQNIEAIPAVRNMIMQQVEQMFVLGQIPGIQTFVDTAQIKTVIDAAVQSLVEHSLDSLIQDADWIDKIQAHVATHMSTRISERLSAIDVNSVIAQEVRENIARWRSEFSSNFSSTGIRDLATDCELVISDGAVVAQSGLAAKDLMVEQDLITHNLTVTGCINTDCQSWNALADVVADKTQNLLGQAWQQQLVAQILDLAKQQGIDFDSITVHGHALIQGTKLNPAVTETAIQKLGILRDLNVAGPLHVNQTLNVENGRVGINTDTPDMAMTIWDEEVSVSLGKISHDRAWIGSNRNQILDIGTNRRRAITIEADGLVVVDRLRVDRWRISFGNSVPNHSGTRGDVVINHDPKPGSPFAWQCLGAFKWQPINLA